MGRDGGDRRGDQPAVCRSRRQPDGRRARQFVLCARELPIPLARRKLLGPMQRLRVGRLNAYVTWTDETIGMGAIRVAAPRRVGHACQPDVVLSSSYPEPDRQRLDGAGDYPARHGAFVQSFIRRTCMRSQGKFASTSAGVLSLRYVLSPREALVGTSAHSDVP